MRTDIDLTGIVPSGADRQDWVDVTLLNTDYDTRARLRAMAEDVATRGFRCPATSTTGRALDRLGRGPIDGRLKCKGLGANGVLELLHQIGLMLALAERNAMRVQVTLQDNGKPPVRLDDVIVMDRKE